MIFKDYFSSDAWFDSLQGHFMNIALTDLNERWAKPYIAKEVILFNWDALAGGVVYCVSNVVGGFCYYASTTIEWAWNHTIGRLFNSVDNHDTDNNIELDQPKATDDIKTFSTIKEAIVLNTSTVLNTEVGEPNSPPNESDIEILGQSDSLTNAV